MIRARMTRHFVVLLICTLISLGATSPTARDNLAEYVEYEGGDDGKTSRIDGSYIVFFKDTAKDYTLEKHLRNIKLEEGQGFHVRHSNFGPLLAYSADIGKDNLEAVRKDDKVDAVVENFAGKADSDNDQVECDEDSFVGGRSLHPRAVQSKAGWGLAWVSADKKLSYPSSDDFDYVDDAGKGVDVFVLDTGINQDSNEFGQRRNTDIPPYDKTQPRHDDSVGHGTKVASIIGGKTFGVAKSCTLHSVNIRDTKENEPSADHFVKAVTDIVNRHNTKKTNDANYKGSIINISAKLGSNINNRFNNVLDKAYHDGVFVVASAGNDGYDDEHWPSKHPHVISSAAMTPGYHPYMKAINHGSNFGAGVIDIWAPGTTLPALTGDPNKQCVSGTSYAAAHVSGIMATYFSMEPQMTPDMARRRLFENAYAHRVELPKVNINGFKEKEYQSSPRDMASTGFGWGQKQDPKVAYKNGPQWPVRDGSEGSDSGPSCPPGQKPQPVPRAIHGPYVGSSPVRRNFSPFYPRAAANGNNASGGPGPGSGMAAGTGTALSGGTATGILGTPMGTGTGKVTCVDA